MCNLTTVGHFIDPSSANYLKCLAKSYLSGLCLHSPKSLKCSGSEVIVHITASLGK